MSTGFPDYLQGFQQPNALYVTSADVLRIAAATSQTNETVTVAYRLWRANRTLKRATFTVSPSISRAVLTADETMEEGFLLGVSCKASVASQRGQTFARVFLTDSAVGLGQPTQMLMADYVTSRSSPGHPNGRVVGPTEGPGALFTRGVANPAAGVEWTDSVPANTRWRIFSITGTLVASANPGNRQVVYRVGAGGGWSQVPFGVMQTAGQGFVYVAAPGLPYFAASAASRILAPIANDVIISAQSNGTINSLTANLDAGDQWSGVLVNIEEWLDNV